MFNEQTTIGTTQDKHKEVDFFNRCGELDEYDGFTDVASRKFIESFIKLSGLPAGAKVADLGCGCGVFTNLLHGKGYEPVGLDISARQLAIARSKYPAIRFVEGDVEALPFSSGSLDAVLLSGVVHHLPDPRRCATEVFRVIKRGGRFMAFDPNRRNPFMWLYRDKSSPFYSATGVTENERPVLADEVRRIFAAADLKCETDYVSGIAYRYVASPLARCFLPLYNLLDNALFRVGFMKPYSAFVLTFGEKP